MEHKYPDKFDTFQAKRVTSLGHYVWDIENDQCIHCSEQHARLHGMSVESYVAQSSTLEGLAHPEDIGVVRQAYHDLRKGMTFQIEFRLLRQDGSIRVVRKIGHPVFNEQGRVVQEIGTSQDITEEVRLKKDVAASESRYRGLFEQSPIPFMEEDWNRVLQRLETFKFPSAQELAEFLRRNPSQVQRL